MADKEIQVGYHYAACHLSGGYRMAVPKSMSKSESDAEHTVSIPFNEALSKEDAEYIVEQIKETKKVVKI